MRIEDLTGQKVKFGVSDPHDFFSKERECPLTAAVQAISGEALLLKLDASITYDGEKFDHLVATARHTDKKLTLLISGEAIPINLTPAIVDSSKDTTAESFFVAAQAWRRWHLVGGLEILE